MKKSRAHNRELLKEISKGSYGIVYRNITTNNSHSSVVKRNFIDKSISFSGSIREADILYKLGSHPNIVKLTQIVSYDSIKNSLERLDVETAKSYKDDKIHFIFEEAMYDTVHLIEKEPEFSNMELRYFLLDILMGMEYIHKQVYIHRDLKTNNLLVFPPDAKFNRRYIKICDFGITKRHNKNGSMTPRVITYWYRAPEICLGESNYGYEVDIWSYGAVAFELASRRALCENVECKGTEILKEICRKIPEECFNLAADYPYKTRLPSMGCSKEEFMKNLQLGNTFEADLGKGSSQQLYDLIVKSLAIDPIKRPTATELINHPFFAPILHEYGYRKDYMSIGDHRDEPYGIVNCPERAWMASLILTIYNERKEYEWFRYEIAFQAISLLDRYLAWYAANYPRKEEQQIINKTSPKGDRNGGDSEAGPYHTMNGMMIRTITTLYMLVKYYLTFDYIVPFETFVIESFRKTEVIKFAEDFESTLLDVFKYKIYQPTPYELIAENKGILSEENIKAILYEYATIKEFKGTLGALSDKIANQLVD